MSTNPNKIITLQELINAQVDAYKLELIMNEAPWVEVTTRLGRKCYSIATIQAIIDDTKQLSDTQLEGIRIRADLKLESIESELERAVLRADLKLESIESELNQAIGKYDSTINQEIVEIQEAIRIAAAAGAGENGWTDSLVQTWSGRNQQAKNKDSIHVLDFKYKDGIAKSDQETIQDAVNYCLPRNMCLDHEGSHLNITGNIENFWGVSHKGQGSITRNGYKFNITPILAQSSEIIVKDGALTLNDGLSPDFPTTITSAFNYLSRLSGRASVGTWRVRVIGLIKSAPIHSPKLPKFLNPLEFCGEDVASGVEPISIWDGDGRTTYAINFTRVPVDILIKNIALKNWKNPDGNAGGFVFDIDSQIFTDNLRCRNMNIGVWSQKSYLNVQNSVFEDISTFACSVAYNGYGNIGVLGAGNTFNRCNVNIAVGRGAICYVTDNIFNNIQSRAIEVNKNARCREHGNKYVNYDPNFTGSQCCVLVEEGAIFNNDNFSGLPSNITAELTSDKPFLRLLSGGSFHQYTPKNGEALHESAAVDPFVAITTNDLINLTDLMGKRLLALPAYALYTDAFNIRIVLLCSMSANTSFTFSLNGNGSGEAASLGKVTIPAIEKLANFVLEINYMKAAGSDTVFSYATAPQIGVATAFGQHKTALQQTYIRKPSEENIIWRPYIQRVSGAGTINVYAVKTYVEI